MEYVILVGIILGIYCSIAFIFLLCNCLGAGYNGETWTKKDVMGSILWPLSLMVLNGLLIRICVESIKKYKSLKGKKSCKK